MCGEQVGCWALGSVQGGTLGVSPPLQLAPASCGGSEVTVGGASAGKRPRAWVVRVGAGALSHGLARPQAFNTFIDDVFAFIVTMPTSHRLACFRDDVVFLVYLYQRW